MKKPAKRPHRLWVWVVPALAFGVLAAISPITTSLVWAAGALLAVLGLIGLRLLGFPRRPPARARKGAKPRGKKTAGQPRRKSPARAPARPVRRRG